MANRVKDVAEKTKSLLISKLKKSGVRDFEPASIVNWVGMRLQRRGPSFYGKVLTIVLSTYFLSDLTALMIGKYIPEPPTPSRMPRMLTPAKRQKTLDDFNIIHARNLFNSKGLIPGEDKGPSTQDPGGAPVPTTLPFTLVGTLILNDELKSIATIEDKSASSVYPVRVKDEIPSKASILKVEPRRVTFVNLSNNRREYVELPEDLVTSNPRITLGGPAKGSGGGGAGIEKVSSTQFNVSRQEVDKTLADLNNVLTQARAVPNFENGVPSGYKLFQIVPGSIYDKLGLQNGDVIAGLNGQTINDPGKAFELLNQLRESSHLDLQIKRDGRTMGFSYEIR